MVATEFLDLFNNIRGIGQTGILDFSDKLNTIFTVSITIICILIVTVKQYFQDPLSCYTATQLGGSNIDGYINNYCWVEGTYVLPIHEVLRIDAKQWESLKSEKIMYYQWIPFVLAIQCVLFIIPRFLWQMLTYNRAGTELERLVTVACEGASADADTQESNINHVAQKLEQMIMATRETNQGARARLRHNLFNIFGCLTFSKRMGTWTVAVYFFMKLVYLGNNVGQIYLMQRFLGLHRNYTFFGTELASNIIAGQDWKQTYVFPRVTFCRVPFQQLGSVNYQVSQCVLGINYLYEKVFIFLWFWLFFVSICTLLSIPIWYIRMSSGSSRVSFIKKRLLLANKANERDRKLFGPFTRLYLRHDGVFLLRMLALNAGDYVTSEITAKLFQVYKDKLVGRNMYDDRRFAEFEDSDVDDLKPEKRTPNGTLDLRGPRHETSQC